MDQELRQRVTAFLHDFRHLCHKHRAFLGFNNTLELLVEGHGSIYFTQFCGNSADVGCHYGQEPISDIDPRVFAA